jgi:ABC-type branched-subunit amino acid transport system substrate-binding protein
VPVIFGPAASTNFLAVCPIAQNAKVILISAESAAAKISECGSYTFRVFPSDALQGKGVAGLVKDLGKTSIALTYISNDWGVGLADVFRKEFTAAGGKIVGEFGHDEGKADYRAEVLKLKNIGAATVVNLTYVKEAATFLKQAKQAGFAPQWIMASAARSPKLVELAGDSAEGVIGTYPQVPRDSAAFKAYADAYMAANPNDKLPVFGGYNWDMVMLTARAAALAKSYTSDAIRDVLPDAGKAYDGATGNKTFDANGDVVDATYGAWTVKDGAVVDYKK